MSFIRLVMIAVLLTVTRASNFFENENIEEPLKSVFPVVDYSHKIEQTLSFPCPDAHSIAPCKCVALFEQKLLLDCSAVMSDVELANVFQQNFPVKEFWRFLIYSNTFVTVIGDIFNGITFQEIYLGDIPNLIFMSGYTLESCKKVLEKIDIRNTDLGEKTFPTLELQVLEKLSLLYFSHSEFSTVPQVDSDTLTMIGFEDGFISELPADTFALAPNVHMWSVSHQNISVVESRTFRLLEDSDNTIYLDFNALHTIHPGAFIVPPSSGNLSLTLWIQGNQLTTLDQAAYGEVFPFVEDILLYDNPWLCGCDLAWLISNKQYWDKVTENYHPTCADGTLMIDLDPHLYHNLCHD